MSHHLPGQIQSQPFWPGARLAGREQGGPCAFPRRPPGNELFRAELGSGQRSSRDLDEDKQGLRDFGLQRLSRSHPVPALTSPSTGGKPGAHPKGWESGQSGKRGLESPAGGGEGQRRGSVALTRHVPGGLSSPGDRLSRGRSLEIESQARTRRGRVCVCVCTLTNVCTPGT